MGVCAKAAREEELPDRALSSLPRATVEAWVLMLDGTGVVDPSRVEEPPFNDS